MSKDHCQAKKCSRPIRAKQYCDRHYRSWRRGELPNSRYKICKAETCKKPMVGKGYCQTHFDAWKTSRKHVTRTQAAQTKAAAPAPTATPAEPAA